MKTIAVNFHDVTIFLLQFKIKRGQNLPLKNKRE